MEKTAPVDDPHSDSHRKRRTQEKNYHYKKSKEREKTVYAGGIEGERGKGEAIILKYYYFP